MVLHNRINYILTYSDRIEELTSADIENVTNYIVKSIIIREESERKWLIIVEQLYTKILSESSKNEAIQLLITIINEHKSYWLKSFKSRSGAFKLIKAIICIYYTITNEINNDLLSLFGQIIESSLLTNDTTSVNDTIQLYTKGLNALYKHIPTSLTTAVTQWTGAEYTLATSITIANNKTAIITETGQEFYNPILQRLIDLYTKQILNTKSIYTTPILLLQPLISSLTQAEWSAPSVLTEPFDSILLKTLKKAPEGSSKVRPHKYY